MAGVVFELDVIVLVFVAFSWPGPGFFATSQQECLGSHRVTVISDACLRKTYFSSLYTSTRGSCPILKVKKK